MAGIWSDETVTVNPATRVIRASATYTDGEYSKTFSATGKLDADAIPASKIKVAQTILDAMLLDKAAWDATQTATAGWLESLHDWLTAQEEE